LRTGDVALPVTDSERGEGRRGEEPRAGFVDVELVELGVKEDEVEVVNDRLISRAESSASSLLNDPKTKRG
jgi:hypothetical protein